MHGGLILEKPNFKWIMQDRYIELLHFEPELTNILKTRGYEISDEENVPVIKSWLS